ncbi:MAG: M55 family metallopeptidase [bacterium]|jgi:D-amino peptidase
MKIYIHTDIEGIAGWVFYASWSNSLANAKHLERMNHLLTDEVHAAVKACLMMEAEEIYINDSHGSGYNILLEELDPACKIIHGRGGHGPSWLPLLDESFDAAIGIGMHAMAGTPSAVCPHSCWHVTLGDGREIKLSECTMFAALAGTKGVPVVAVSGDDKIAAEVKEKIPGCETAVVKEGFSSQLACSLVPSAACDLIYEKVKAGLARCAAIEPYRLEGPFKLNISDRDPGKRELAEDMSGDDLWQLMHDVCRCFGNNWGDQSIDDRSWRYPDNLFK